MFNKNFGRVLVIAGILTVGCSSVHAQETVYKWVDEDGVVHFSDAPPDQASPAETEIVTIPRAPSVAAPAQSAVNPPVATAPSTRNQAGQTETAVAPRAEKIDISTLSLADLDLRCEEARERKIAPLRAAEIVKCQQDKRNDPAWCERFNADFGDAGRTTSGTMRPRMFDDLPACAEALQERNRRGR